MSSNEEFGKQGSLKQTKTRISGIEGKRRNYSKTLVQIKALHKVGYSCFTTYWDPISQNGGRKEQ
jgi:hypothetical protein